MGLKKRQGEPSGHRRKAPRAAFVELIAPPAAALEECVIEFESSRGAKMRIQWKAISATRLGQSAARLGGKQKDDSDHTADADSGGGGVGRLPERHRLVGRVVPAEAGCRSIFGLPVSYSAAGEQPLCGCWSMTGRDSGWRPNVYPKDASAGGPRTERRRRGTNAVLRAHQAQVLLAAGNPDIDAAPVWRKVS